MSSEEKAIAELANALKKAMGNKNETSPMKTDITTEKESLKRLVIKPSLTEKIKELKGFKTGTFIDSMFLDAEEKPINGIPFGSNSIITGLPNSGKSLFLEELVLKIANDGHKICFTTSEEIFSTENARMDLENRMRGKAKVLGLDWKNIHENLHVLDVVENAELRNWYIFAKTYRTLVEYEKVEFLAIDSLTLLEDSRGQLKYRFLELIKYGQKKGVTSILINQRSVGEADSLGMAGGISLSHIADIVFILDYKKVSSWDKQLKLDIQTAKQGEVSNFFRILKCRMARYKANYFGYQITKDGLVRLNQTSTST